MWIIWKRKNIEAKNLHYWALNSSLLKNDIEIFLQYLGLTVLSNDALISTYNIDLSESILILFFHWYYCLVTKGPYSFCVMGLRKCCFTCSFSIQDIRSGKGAIPFSTITNVMKISGNWQFENRCKKWKIRSQNYPMYLV